MEGAVAPSERIVLGGIGIGSRGEFDLNWMLPEPDVQFVAICDARKERREAVKKLVDKHYGNSDCKMYPDMREFLATRPDIDALLIATGDRWHALASIMAMRAGKDVYSEKPSCMTIAEGRAVVRDGPALRPDLPDRHPAAQRGQLRRRHRDGPHRPAGQGPHRPRPHRPWDAAEMSHDWLPAEPQPPKDEVDWDAWLGPCPWRPYNSAYVRGGWRGHYDFHTSCIGEWGAHTFAQSQAGIDALNTSAVEYQLRQQPHRRRHGHQVRQRREDDPPARRAGTAPAACGSRAPRAGSRSPTATRSPRSPRPSLLADADKLVADYMERTRRPMNHVRNFFDCVKSRQPTVANPEVMHHSMSTVHAANICMWLKRDMIYDPVKEEFVNDAEANRLRTRAQREPWII